MLRPILTPEDHLLVVVVLALACVSPSALASRLVGRIGPFENSFETSHFIALLVLSLAGIAFLRPDLILTVHWGVALGIGLAAPVGWLAYFLDQRIIRASRRKMLRSGRLRPARAGSKVPAQAAIGVVRQGALRVACTGFLEEIVFRGILFHIALQADALLAKVALVVLITLLFAANHIPYGRIHFVAKLPLSALAGGLTILTGSVLGAALAHFLFNHLIMRDLSDRAGRHGRN